MAQVAPSTKGPTSAIKAVGFDMGGVILTSERQAYYRRFQEAFGTPIDEIQAAFDQFVPSLERSDIGIDGFWRAVTRSLGVDYDAKRDHDLWNRDFIQYTPIRQEIILLADRLHANGYKTGILSNTHAEHIAINKTRHIFDHFNVVLLSSEIKAAKPDAKAYLKLAEALNLLPHEIVFIDDLAVNVVGAEEVGMKGIEFFGYDDLIIRLKELHIKTN